MIVPIRCFSCGKVRSAPRAPPRARWQRSRSPATCGSATWSCWPKRTSSRCTAVPDPAQPIPHKRDPQLTPAFPPLQRRPRRARPDALLLPPHDPHTRRPDREAAQVRPQRRQKRPCCTPVAPQRPQAPRHCVPVWR